MKTLLRSLGVCSVLLACAAVRAQDAISIDRDDLELWQAAMQGKYYHNRVLIAPKDASHHFDIVSRCLALPTSTDRYAIANAIMVQDILLDRFLKDSNIEQEATKQLPAAWKVTSANLYLKALLGRQPSYREIVDGDPAGGLVGLIDRNRKRQTGAYLNQMAMRHVSSDLAHLIDQKYRSLLGSRPGLRPNELVIDQTQDEVGVYVPGQTRSKIRLGATMARIAYTGTRPLENVMVITHATMRPIDAEAHSARALIRAVNEIADPGAERNNDADNYVVATQLMHHAPQGSVEYYKRVEPGDVLYSCLYLHGSFWDVQEAKLSIYSTSGALLDHVVMTGGPHNDLNATSEARKRDEAAREVKTTGPIFKPVPLYERLELTLKPAADGGAAMVDVCVPTQQSFTSLGKSIPAPTQPIVAIAQSPTHYAAIAGKREVGEGLVLIPKTAVAKTATIDERNDEELAAAKASAAQAKERQEEEAFQKRISKLSPQRQVEETMKRNNEKLRKALTQPKPSDKTKGKSKPKK